MSKSNKSSFLFDENSLNLSNKLNYSSLMNPKEIIDLNYSFEKESLK